MKSTITGLDKVLEKLDDLKKKAEELDSTHNVPFSELFPEPFMRKYTEHSTFQELLDSGGYAVQSTEDFLKIPHEAWNAHIVKKTKFSSWDEMRKQAIGEYTKRKLGL